MKLMQSALLIYSFLWTLTFAEWLQGAPFLGEREPKGHNHSAHRGRRLAMERYTWPPTPAPIFPATSNPSHAPSQIAQLPSTSIPRTTASPTVPPTKSPYKTPVTPAPTANTTANATASATTTPPSALPKSTSKPASSYPTAIAPPSRSPSSFSTNSSSRTVPLQPFVITVESNISVNLEQLTLTLETYLLHHMVLQYKQAVELSPTASPSAGHRQLRTSNEQSQQTFAYNGKVLFQQDVFVALPKIVVVQTEQRDALQNRNAMQEALRANNYLPSDITVFNIAIQRTDKDDNTTLLGSPSSHGNSSHGAAVATSVSVVLVATAFLAMFLVSRRRQQALRESTAVKIESRGDLKLPDGNLTKSEDDIDDDEATIVNDSFNNSADESHGINIVLAAMESVSPVTVESEQVNIQKDDKSQDHLSASAPDDESMEGYSLSSLPEQEKLRVFVENSKHVEQENQMDKDQSSDSESQFTFNQVGVDSTTMHSASVHSQEEKDNGFGRIIGIVSYIGNNPSTPARPRASGELEHMSKNSNERRGPFARFRKTPPRNDRKPAFSSTSSLASSSHSIEDQYFDDAPRKTILLLKDFGDDNESHPSDEGGDEDDADDDGRDLSIFAAEIERARVAVRIPVVDGSAPSSPATVASSPTPPSTPERRTKQSPYSTPKHREFVVKDMDQSLSQYLSGRRRTMQKDASHKKNQKHEKER